MISISSIPDLSQMRLSYEIAMVTGHKLLYYAVAKSYRVVSDEEAANCGIYAARESDIRRFEELCDKGRKAFNDSPYLVFSMPDCVKPDSSAAETMQRFFENALDYLGSKCKISADQLYNAVEVALTDKMFPCDNFLFALLNPTAEQRAKILLANTITEQIEKGEIEDG